MALKRRNLEEDLLWLKIPLLALLSVLLLSAALWWLASRYQDEMRTAEFQVRGDLELLAAQVQEIEAAEQIIVDNIGVFEQMQSRGLLDQEDRVALLDTITTLRNRHNLYPVTVEIAEQDRVVIPYVTEVDYPEEQISLRGTPLRLELPLLHEGDLARLLEGLYATGGLFVVDECTMREAIESDNEYLSLLPHQMADCALIWYSFQRETYVEPEY
ncbi:MAG: hypothetical protein MRY76_08990 [Pseudomonadales bacterium]|nr:hypothetical protein [Pseudomonadales bacterium]